MIEINEEIRAMIDKATENTELAEDEYIDSADGLIHCKNCGGPRQTVVKSPFGPGYFVPRCVCPCQQEAERRRKEEEEKRQRMERIKRRKAQGLQDRYLYDYTFANDNGQNPLMEKARAYVEHWSDAFKGNTGLLLFGDVGTGKSFFAGCIANALLEQDVLVLMTNFPTILNRLTGMFSEDRAEFIACQRRNKNVIKRRINYVILWRWRKVTKLSVSLLEKRVNDQLFLAHKFLAFLETIRFALDVIVTAVSFDDALFAAFQLR